VGPEGVLCRVVVATHPAPKKKSPVGVTRAGVVYELFFTNLPQQAFTASDVVELYLHRGAFEPALADEDIEQDPDRWCSHSAWGQECWQVVSQWVWNLRLELGHMLKPEPVRTTEFAPAHGEAKAGQAPPQGYEPPVIGGAWKAERYSGEDFVLQPDGTVCCPEGKRLFPQERRWEGDGSVRIVYEARIADCRACPKRPQCQWHGHQAQHPRRVSVLLHPLRQQEQWEAHAAFMDALADEGFVVLGGPLGKGEKTFLLIMAAESEQTIESRLANDPWTPLRLLRTASIERWEILLNASK
jgi:uncharacterized protein YciI